MKYWEESRMQRPRLTVSAYVELNKWKQVCVVTIAWLNWISARHQNTHHCCYATDSHTKSPTRKKCAQHKDKHIERYSDTLPHVKILRTNRLKKNIEIHNRQLCVWLENKNTYQYNCKRAVGLIVSKRVHVAVSRSVSIYCYCYCERLLFDLCCDHRPITRFFCFYFTSYLYNCVEIPYKCELRRAWVTI